MKRIKYNCPPYIYLYRLYPKLGKAPKTDVKKLNWWRNSYLDINSESRKKRNCELYSQMERFKTLHYPT